MIPSPPVLFDSNGTPLAPATNRPGQALSSPQGGVVVLGSDYGSAAKAQAVKVDAAGSAYVSITGVNGQPAPYVGQTSPAQALQTGQLLLGRQDLPTPSNYQPALMDSQGALITTGAPKPTFRAVATAITAAANKVLCSFVNGSSQVLRLSVIHVFVPSQGTLTQNGGTLLGVTGTTSVTQYYPVFCELRRIAAHSGGSVMAPAPSDTADTLANGIAWLSGSTVSAYGPTLHRRDALITSDTATPWYKAECITEKNLVFRPGEGAALVCVSNGTIASAGGTTTAVIDLQVVFSQAQA